MCYNNTLTPAVAIQKISYAAWPNCYRISNGDVELIVTSDVGPRILRYAFPGGHNIFKEFPEQLGRSGEPDWQPRGGHRIWVAPEHPRDSYPADNFPVDIQFDADRLVATAPVEPETGLQKQLVVHLAATGSAVTIVHNIANRGVEPRRLAPWALTMLAPGGTGFHPFPPRGTHPEVLPPTHPLVMWAFTDLSDPRWKFTRKYLILRQDPSLPSPQKLGTFNPQTVGAYLLGSDLFIKRYRADASKPYPDFGVSFETFTNGSFLELETLGPLELLAPGESLSHTEHWSLHRDVTISSWSDEELDRVLLPRL